MTLFRPIDKIENSASESAETAATDFKYKWMIIDGALIVEDTQHILINQFVNHHQGAEFRNLFVNTKWKEVLDVAPMLVSYHPDIEAWAQSKAPWRFGLVFESNASLEELVEHWHTLIHCQHIGLEGSLSRLYDPIAFYHLLNATEEARQVAWLGPISKIWLPDYVDQHYFYAERPELVDATPLERAQFTDPEWQGLTDAKRYASSFLLIQHIDQYFPDYWQENQNKPAHINEQLSKLNSLGELTMQGAVFYMNILCRMGDIWNENNGAANSDESVNSYQEIVKILKQQEQPLTERLKAANKLALAYYQDKGNRKEVTA
jgi:hypothetical protein